MHIAHCIAVLRETISFEASSCSTRKSIEHHFVTCAIFKYIELKNWRKKKAQNAHFIIIIFHGLLLQIMCFSFIQKFVFFFFFLSVVIHLTFNFSWKCSFNNKIIVQRMTSQFFVYVAIAFEMSSFIDFYFSSVCVGCLFVSNSTKSVANTVQMALSWQSAAGMSTILPFRLIWNVVLLNKRLNM